MLDSSWRESARGRRQGRLLWPIDEGNYVRGYGYVRRADGVDKATDFIDDKTGGKFSDQLDKVDDLAEKLAGDAEEAVDEATDGDDA